MKEYVFTQVDTLTLWQAEDGKITALKHDLVRVPDSLSDEDSHEWPMLGDEYYFGDYIDQDSGKPFTIPGVDLDLLDILDDYHDEDAVTHWLKERGNF